MGLLDRVKASQVPGAPGAPATNGPAPAGAAGDTAHVLRAAPAATATATATRPEPPPTRIAPPPGADPLSPAFTAAKVHVHAKLLEKYADKLVVTDRVGVRDKIQELADEYFRGNQVTMTKSERDRLVESLLDDVLGLGPLQQLVDDPEISEIMINHPKQIYVEKKGTPTLSSVTFESSKQLMLVIDRIVSTVGRRVDESSPMADARLVDGSRVNVIIPPLALKGPCMTIRKFSREKLRRPDRIIVGECRGGEALDMLQAMNTGHDGSMSTLHANNPHECLGRLETLVLMAGADLPSRAIREQMASAVHIIVQQQRLRGGPRKVVSIAEITGIETGDIKYQEIFVFKQIGVNEGKAVGYHTATGIKPMRLDHMKAGGEELDDAIFTPTPEPKFEELY